MIRSCFLRNTAVKIAFKKEIKNVKNFRYITSMGRPPRKKTSFRQSSFILMDSDRRDLSPNFRFYCSYPNHHKVLLPALSPTMEHGTIISWEKKEGDKLNEGDLLAEIETDKATMGFETPEEGYLAKILVPAGTKNVPIGKLVCIIVENESDVAAFKNFVDAGDQSPPKEAKTQAAPPSPPPPTPTPAPAPAPASAPSPPKTSSAPKPSVKPDATETGKVYASPLAKKTAEEKGISLQNVAERSGLYGSIKVADLSSAKQAAHVISSSPYADLSVSNLKNIIAKRILESKQKIPHYYLTVDINISNLLAVKRRINSVSVKDGVNLSLNDFVIKAVSLASKKVPEANSMWMETFIRQYKNVHVSVAVSTSQGIFTPIVFYADQKGLATISSEMKQLAVKAREGKLEPHEFEGGTITVSNLGMFGVNSFSAIINPPQSCIVAVGSSEKRLLPDLNSDKGFKLCEILWVTLSCDHRVLDGAVGAKWLSTFREYMENPDVMML